jgi:hypothetical protein
MTQLLSFMPSIDFHGFHCKYQRIIAMMNNW